MILLIQGEIGVGKTTLIRRLLGDRLPEARGFWAFPSTSTQWGSHPDTETRTGWGGGCRDSPGVPSRRPSSGRRCGWRPFLREG